MRTNNGAFQLSRSIYDSEIWLKPPEWLKVWIYLLGNVNHKDNNLFKRGENLFNYQVIAIECNVTYNIVNKCINFLKSAKQVSTRKTTRGVVLAINNYDKYQDLSSYRQNESKTEAKQKQNKSYTITEQGNNETMKQYKTVDLFSEGETITELVNFINIWNISFQDTRKVTEKIKAEWLKMRKKYPIDDVRVSFTGYKKSKLENPTLGRLSPLAFITQENGIPNYL